MNNNQRKKIIQRESLVNKVVSVLKPELPHYARVKWLPGERVLSRQLQVSRTTLRAALAKLQRQKLIRSSPQRGYRVLAMHRRCKEDNSRFVGCVGESFPEGYEPRSQIMIRDIGSGLNGAGYELKVLTNIRLRGCNRGRQLSNLIAEQRAACWLLFGTAFKTQHWFMNHRIPSLVLGSCYPGIKLPNLDVDYRAICRHAAIMLWRMGHRRICMLGRRHRLGGDIFGEEGFRSAVSQLSRGSLAPEIVYHHGGAGDIRRTLDKCFSGKPSPTAFLVSHPQHALTALCYFMNKGVRVPRDVSLVCRDDSEFMEHMIPAMTRYAVDRRAFARRCVRSLIQLATAGELKPGSRWMMARLIPGETVAPATREIDR